MSLVESQAGRNILPKIISFDSVVAIEVGAESHPALLKAVLQEAVTLRGMSTKRGS
jgi:hypothetical protein